MSLATQLANLSTAVGTKVKEIKVQLYGTSSGTLASLQTTDKTSIVAAINEARTTGGSGTPPDASETVKGILELATQTEVNTGTDDLRAVTPLKFQTRLAAYAQPLSANLTSLAGQASTAFGLGLLNTADASALKAAVSGAASEAATGFVELATQTEVNTGTDDARAITPLKFQTRLAAYAQPLDSDLTSIAALATTSFGRGLLTTADAAALKTAVSGAASETATGFIELATLAEVATGTDTTRAVTAAGVRQERTALKAEILGAATPAALDTLDELAAALGDDANFSATITTALGNRLRVDTAAQGLDGTQQQNGRTNLSVYSQAEIGNPEQDLAAIFAAALV